MIAGAFEQGIAAILKALSQPDVLAAFWLTIKISLVVVAVQLVFGTLVAWVLVRDHFRGRELINGLIDVPFAISPVVVGYMLILLFGRNGLLAPLLAPLNIRVAFAVPGMVLATLFVTLPFMIRELIPMLEAFGIQQEQSAATMGASSWQIFWRITLPALRWGMIYGVSLTFARALGEFGAVLVIGGGIQGQHRDGDAVYLPRPGRAPVRGRLQRRDRPGAVIAGAGGRHQPAAPPRGEKEQMSLYVSESGPSDAPSLVFLHGGGVSGLDVAAAGAGISRLSLPGARPAGARAQPG